MLGLECSHCVRWTELLLAQTGASEGLPSSPHLLDISLLPVLCSGGRYVQFRNGGRWHRIPVIALRHREVKGERPGRPHFTIGSCSPIGGTMRNSKKRTNVRSTMGRILMALVLVLAIGALFMTPPAFAKDHHGHHGHWRHYGYGPHGYYYGYPYRPYGYYYPAPYYPAPVYGPPAVVYAPPAPPPGISFVFPIRIR